MHKDNEKMLRQSYFNSTNVKAKAMEIRQQLRKRLNNPRFLLRVTAVC